MICFVVFKIYKFYIGGKFLCSESGCSYEISILKGVFFVNVVQVSCKDVWDVVVVVCVVFFGWSGVIVYNCGQVFYWIVELFEGWYVQFVDEFCVLEGVLVVIVVVQVDEVIDSWVWYVGWVDKYVQVVGLGNFVVGLYFNFLVFELIGVVVIVVFQGMLSLFGLVGVFVLVLVSGNIVVVVVDQVYLFSVISLVEVFVISDVFGGVVNIFIGFFVEIVFWLVVYVDVNVFDFIGVGEFDWVELQIVVVDMLKWVIELELGVFVCCFDCILVFIEMKIVWYMKVLLQ